MKKDDRNVDEKVQKLVEYSMKSGQIDVEMCIRDRSLSVNRRKALVDAYAKKYDAADIYECPVCIVESEIHMVQALENIKEAGCNALVVYLGNFGPEISETLLAKHFDGPVMFVAAAEESGKDLVQGRGDAYCGMLNASYNLKPVSYTHLRLSAGGQKARRYRGRSVCARQYHSGPAGAPRLLKALLQSGGG